MVSLIFILALQLINVSAKCTIKVEPGFPNRTLCTVETLNADDPLRSKDKTPDYLYLDVSYGEIPKDAFTKLKTQKELWFIGNNITFIQPGAFDNLTDLENLAITNTLISNISAFSFRGVPNLKMLSLARNRIRYIEENAFSGLDNLQQLLLTENALRRIDEWVFRGVDQLQALYLDDNPIEYAHVNAFRRMTNLTRLVISFVKGKNVEDSLDFLDDSRKVVNYVN